MKIALIGYGKMGKEIEKLAMERGHSIVLTIDLLNTSELTTDNLKKTHVAIEFTSPETAVANFRTCFNAGIPVVSGTTGWLNQWDEVVNDCLEKNAAFFYASNFSVGVQLFYNTCEHLSKLVNSHNQYEISVEETHHTKKLDAPSGTAKTLAEKIIPLVKGKEKWTLNDPAKNEIGIKSIREGDVVGIHRLIFDSPSDYIEVKHFAKTRRGLALGAMLAAEFLNGKKGIYGMEDLLKL